MPPLDRTRKGLLLGAPIAAVMTAFTLARFAYVVQPYLRIRYGVWFEMGMVVGQILFQQMFIGRRPAIEKLDYSLVLVGVSAFGAVMLWPMLLVAPAPSIAGVYFLGVAGIMFGVHWWLTKRRGLPTLLCVTWMVYRLLLLFGVFRFEVLVR